MIEEPATARDEVEIDALVRSWNEKLVSAAQESVAHAFNVGCSFSLLPMAILVGLVFVVSRGNWVIALIAAVMGLVSALGFASLVSTTARTKSIEQTYQLYVAPGIERYLASAQLTRPEFDRQASSSLPEGAPLRKYLAAPPEEERAAEE